MGRQALPPAAPARCERCSRPLSDCLSTASRGYDATRRRSAAHEAAIAGTSRAARDRRTPIVARARLGPADRRCRSRPRAREWRRRHRDRDAGAVAPSSRICRWLRRRGAAAARAPLLRRRAVVHILHLLPDARAALRAAAVVRPGGLPPMAAATTPTARAGDHRPRAPAGARIAESSWRRRLAPRREPRLQRPRTRRRRAGERDDVGALDRGRHRPRIPRGNRRADLFQHLGHP